MPDSPAPTRAALEPTDPALPLGPRSLEERRVAVELAPGAHHLRIERGHPSPRETYSVDLAFGSQAYARAVARRLRRAGLVPNVRRIDSRAQDDPLRREPLGWRVRCGGHRTRVEAEAVRSTLALAGINAPRVSFSGEDGERSTGPWLIDVLTLDPQAIGEPVALLVQAWLDAGAAPGLARLGGVPRCEADNGRTALVLPEASGEGAYVGAPVGPRVAVLAGGPRLLRHGRLEIPAHAEGFVWAEVPEFYYRFAVRRQRRTVAGVRADGTLVLATVHGAEPGRSVGASLIEAANLLLALGARDGVNLDDGHASPVRVAASLLEPLPAAAF